MYHLFYLFILLRIGKCENDQNESNWILFGTKDRVTVCITWHATKITYPNESLSRKTSAQADILIWIWIRQCKEWFSIMLWNIRRKKTKMASWKISSQEFSHVIRYESYGMTHTAWIMRLTFYYNLCTPFKHDIRCACLSLWCWVCCHKGKKGKEGAAWVMFKRGTKLICY